MFGYARAVAEASCAVTITNGRFAINRPDNTYRAARPNIQQSRVSLIGDMPNPEEDILPEERVTTTEIERSRLDWVGEHRRDYLASRGVKGHVVDLREIGGLRFTTTLLLKTIGRKTAQARITPLIYGDTGGEVVIVASKGGADIHPAWYLNLKDHADISFQIATQAFRSSWREPAGAERDEIWSFMERLYPPYRAYQAATARKIPLVILTALEEMEVFAE